jgi:hypothetical protein
LVLPLRCTAGATARDQEDEERVLFARCIFLWAAGAKEAA